MTNERKQEIKDWFEENLPVIIGVGIGATLGIIAAVSCYRTGVEHGSIATAAHMNARIAKTAGDMPAYEALSHISNSYYHNNFRCVRRTLDRTVKYENRYFHTIAKSNEIVDAFKALRPAQGTVTPEQH